MINEKLKQFKNKTIFHPKLKNMFDEVNSHINQDDGYPLLVMYGPTGVGKSTLNIRLQKSIIEKVNANNLIVPHSIPVAGIEAASPESGNYNWKDHDIRCLDALNEPLPNQKKIFLPDIFEGQQNIIPFKRQARQGSTTPELRRALEQALKIRSPHLFIIDEAQHLSKIGSGRRLLDQMDMIKSLANKTKIKHLLIGTYELQHLLGLSAQLSRRTIEFHFPRYLYNNQEDLNHYHGIINTFQKLLPTEQESNLISSFDLLYEYSLGCVGILQVWLYQSLAYCLENNHKSITPKTLEKTALPARRLQKIASEIFEGESRLTDHDAYDLRAALKMNTSVSFFTAKKPSKPKKKKLPGVRDPKRDPVGRTGS